MRLLQTVLHLNSSIIHYFCSVTCKLAPLQYSELTYRSSQMKYFIITCLIALILQPQVFGSVITVRSLTDLNTEAAKSGVKIKLKPGKYDLKDLPRDGRVLAFSGSNNTIDLSGVYVKATVGLVRTSYIHITGNKNTVLGGEFEDVYEKKGLTEITNFSSYNKDRRLRVGLRGAPVLRVEGNGNTVNGIKLTVRGSYPYGYGSIYGITTDNIYGLDKRCGILIWGVGNTLDGVEVQQRAFGHAIYMQGPADKTVIKNSLVEGQTRETNDIYEEKGVKDLPRRSNYNIMADPSRPIPRDTVYSMCEDGIRMYDIEGSILVENCTVRKMRGGIRLYLGGPAVVKNSTAEGCASTNFNLPAGGELTDCIGDFTNGPLSDYRLNRSQTKAEWTIRKSPDAIGSHNIIDIGGNGHDITLKREDGPFDKEEKRVIMVTGSRSVIINKTEYTIMLAESAKRNRVWSYGPIEGNKKENDTKRIRSLRRRIRR